MTSTDKKLDVAGYPAVQNCSSLKHEFGCTSNYPSAESLGLSPKAYQELIVRQNEYRSSYQKPGTVSPMDAQIDLNNSLMRRLQMTSEKFVDLMRQESMFQAKAEPLMAKGKYDLVGVSPLAEALTKVGRSHPPPLQAPISHL